jgi:hypothetical protein
MTTLRDFLRQNDLCSDAPDEYQDTEYSEGYPFIVETGTEYRVYYCAHGYVYARIATQDDYDQCLTRP